MGEDRFIKAPSTREVDSANEELRNRFRWQFHDSILSNEFYYKENVLIDPPEQRDNLYPWDFAVYDKNSNELRMVINLGNPAEENTDSIGYLYVPRRVRTRYMNKKTFPSDFRKIMYGLIDDYEDLLIELFLEFRSIDFPYPSYSNLELIGCMKQLIRYDAENADIKSRSLYGDKLIQHFHHSIWKANIKGNPSPYDAWQDDESLFRVIENRTLYQHYLSPNKILQGFNVCKVAPKVSVFSAGRAKIIIDRYLSVYDTIFDPFSGFSGRMLGSMSLGKYYIGQDISETHVSESLKIVDFLERTKSNYPELITPSLSIKNILDSHGEYPCLFTCSPYGEKEKWLGVEPDTRSCDDWIDVCMNNFNCERYVFVVDSTIKYKNNIVDEIKNRSHFGSNSEYVLVIDK